MNKKDISLLRRQLTPDSKRLWIRKLVKAYANIGEKEKVILGLDLVDFDELESDVQKLYLNSAKKALSGMIGKNLLEMEIVDSAKREELLVLSMEEWNEESIRALLQEIIDTQSEPGSVFINAFQCEFHTKNHDETYIYRFFIICIHEAKESKEALYFDNLERSVKKTEKMNMLLNPAITQAVIYPLFDQGEAVTDYLIYQCGSKGLVNAPLVENVFGAQAPMAAKEQQQAFVGILSELSDHEISLSTIKKLSEQVDFIQETSEPEMDEPSLDREDLFQVLLASGIDEEKFENFESLYEDTIGNERLIVNNILPSKKFNFKMDGISIALDKDKLDRISRKEIDGKNVLVIELDNDLVEVNDIPIS